MNIHIKNKALFDELIKSTYFKVEVGSKLYGLKTDKSDTDILCIYRESNKNSLLSSIHHQLQYKDTENNVDYIFTTLPNFVRNIMIGDSTINYEVLFTDELRDSELKFLWDCRYWFRTYNLTKAYLGFAKRDLKQTFNSAFDRNKKLSHAIRGILAANLLLTNNESVHPIYQVAMKDAKAGTLSDEKFDEIRQNAFDTCEDLRHQLNDQLEQKKIWQYFCPLRHRDLDRMVMQYLNGRDRIAQDFSSHPPLPGLEDIYQSLEDGINYP